MTAQFTPGPWDWWDAAAPELHAVLDEIVGSLETTLGARLCAKAISALAKARGEQ